MFCPLCGKQSDASFSFCPYCGSSLKEASEAALKLKQANDEEILAEERRNVGEPEEMEEAEQLSIIDDGEDAHDTSEDSAQMAERAAQDAEKTPVSTNKSEGALAALLGKMLIWTSVIIIAFTFFLAAAVFWGITDAWTPVYSVNTLPQLQNGGNGNSNTALENIYLSEKNILLFEGQTKRVKFEVYPKNANTGDIKWEISGDGASVSANGKLTALTPGWSGVLSVSCGEIKAEANVHVLSSDEAFYETLDWIARKKQHETVDFSESGVAPSAIKSELLYLQESEARRRWGANVFARVNDEMASYTITRKTLINRDTGNIIDCEVYKDPLNGDVRKIVSIERFSDFLNVTDFYFLNGRLAFMFERSEETYRPSPANWGTEGTRLYFEDDAMTTWRNISPADERLQRDRAFVKTDYSYGRSGIEWNRTEYTFDFVTNTVKNLKESLPEPTEEERELAAAEYAAISERAINAAYSIYDKLAEMPETASLYGSVVTMDALPMKGITVRVFSDEYDALVCQTVTGDDGVYSITVPPDNPYTVAVYQNGYTTVQIHEAGKDGAWLAPVRLVPDTIDGGSVILSLIDASFGGAADIYKNGGKLILRKGIGNRAGEPFMEIALPAYKEEAAQDSDEDDESVADEVAYESNSVPSEGEALWINEEKAYRIGIPPGNYTAELVAAGFETAVFNFSSGGSETYVKAAVVTKVTDGAKITLEWENAALKLDSRLILSSGEQIPNGGSGSNTPSLASVTAIASQEHAAGGYYVLDTVNDKNGNKDSRQASRSFAVVSYYTRDGLAAQFYAPWGESGVAWHVFNVSGGELMPVEQIYGEIQGIY